MSIHDKRRNEIQWLRALAASEVVICHSDLIVKTFSDHRIVADPWYGPVSAIGVELFFIVSGYIMCMRVPATKSWASFIWSRIIRICPMYWLLTTVVIIVAMVVPTWRLGGFTLDGETIARSYLMLPEWGFPILQLGWTLEYEMVFYLLVTALMAAGVKQGPMMVPFAWGLAVLGAIGAALGPKTEGSALLFHLASPYMFAFGAGWLFRAIEQAHQVERIRGVAVFGAIAAVALWVGPAWGDALVLRILLACLVFVGFLAARRIFQADNAVNRFAGLIGDASYSLYLTHWFVLSAAGKILGRFGVPAEMDDVVRAAGFLASIAVGVGVFLWIERPLDRWLRARQRAIQGHSSTPLPPARSGSAASHAPAIHPVGLASRRRVGLPRGP